MAKQAFENVVQYLFQIAAHAEFKTLNDQELLKRYVEQRDELAFGELVRRYKAMVWYVCWRVLRHHQDVEDAFQATIMTLVRRAKTILGHATIEGWLHSTAFNVASNAKTNRKRRRAREERNIQMHREQYENHDCRWEMEEVLDKEITRIPEQLRSPLILCYLEGLTQKEAAERLGITIEALNCRLHRGRERLKRRLSKYGMEWETIMLMAHPVAGMHAPQLPTNLVEKTLDMVRIMTLSNGSLETVGISPSVAALLKGALGFWTAKVKIFLGFFLTTLVVAGGGVATYSGWLFLHGERPIERRMEQENQMEKKPEKDQKIPPLTDRFGDPLPPGALDRLGTVRYRLKSNKSLDRLIITPHKTNPLIVHNETEQLWDFTSGKPLSHFCDSHGEVIPIRNASPGTGWILSIDGRLLAKYDKVREVYRFWDMSTCQLLNLEWKGAPQLLALSPDGKTVAVREHDHSLGCWDSATGKQKWTFKKKRDDRDIYLMFSSDGKTLMCLQEEGPEPKINKVAAYRWETSTGKTLAPWTVTNKDISHFIWARDGITLAILPEWTGTVIQLWNMNTGKQVRQIQMKEKIAQGQGRIQFALSPDGRMLAAGAYYQNAKGKISLWDTATGQWLRDFATQGNWPDKLIFSHDGKKLVATSVNSPVIEIYSTDSGKQVNQDWLKRGYCTEVTSVAFSLVGQAVVSTAGERWHSTLDLWDMSTNAGRQPFHAMIPGSDPDGPEYFSVALSPDGKIAASYALADDRHLQRNGNLNVVRVWDVATGRELSHHRVPRDAVVLSFSPNSKFLAGALEGKRTVVWEVATGKQLADTLSGDALAFFPDGKKIVTSSKKGMHIWDIVTCKEFYCLPEGVFSDVKQVAISADGHMLAAIGTVMDAAADRWHWAICLWDIDTSNRSVCLKRPRQLIHGYYDSIAFSPDRKLLATNNWGNSVIHVWEIATGQERCHFNDPHHGSLNSCPPAFSPDGRRLVTGHKDTTILVWDLTGRANGGQLRPIRLSVREMEARWTGLADANAARAAQSLWSLVTAGSPTVTFLKKRMQPIHRKSVTAETLTKLIADLDHSTFTVRKKAREELKELGEAAEANLRQALDNKPSLELRRSVEQLLKVVEEARSLGACSSPDVLRSLRAIEVLEQIGSPEAQRLLDELGRGDPGVLQTLEAQAALRRLRQRVDPS